MVIVLALIYVVPFLVYSFFTLVTDLRSPEGVAPSSFLLGILVSKIGQLWFL